MNSTTQAHSAKFKRFHSKNNSFNSKNNSNSIIRQPLGPPSDTDEYKKQNFRNRQNTTNRFEPEQENNLSTIIINNNNKTNYKLLCIIADNLEKFLEIMPNKQLLGINASLFYNKYPQDRRFLKKNNIKLNNFASMFPSKFEWNMDTNIILLPKPKPKPKLIEIEIKHKPMYAYCYKCIGLIDVKKCKRNQPVYCIWCAKT